MKREKRAAIDECPYLQQQNCSINYDFVLVDRIIVEHLSLSGSFC